jgi:hypothetical protein
MIPSTTGIALLTGQSGWRYGPPANLDEALYRVLAAGREANRLIDLLVRWNVRFRIYQRDPDACASGHARSLERYRHRVIDVAEDAETVLAPLWDRYSRLLEPSFAALGRTASDGPLGPYGGSIAARPIPYGRWLEC